jgi:phosphoesterase RecJ-like protein
MKNKDYHFIIERIDHAKNIVLTTHEKGDADGIGSQLALARILKKKGKHVLIINPDPLSPSYDFLDDKRIIRHFEKTALPQLNSCDLIVVLDANELKRLGELQKPMNYLIEKTIFIDHHVKGKEDDFSGIFDPQASSTAELVFSLLREMGEKPDVETAKLLYAALIFDTRSFRFINNRPSPLLIAAELISTGFDADLVQEKTFASKSRKRMELLGWVLSNMKFTYDHRLVTVKLSAELLGRMQLDSEEVRSIINDLIEIKEVEAAIVLKEFKKNRLKISMRSKRSMTVSDVAIKNGGGGHLRAAGFDTIGDIDQMEQKLIQEFGMKFM